MEPSKIVIRAVQSKDDVEAVVALCATMFPEEAKATGMSLIKWREVKVEELSRHRELWSQWGVACEGDRIIGALIMSVDDEPAALRNYWSHKILVTRRAGCLATFLSMCYDQVLEEPLAPHECLIDFLAVSPKARGKGVGADLVRWAERTAAGILSTRTPDVVAEEGVVMTLWVAADNTPAARLYTREGYTVVKKTDEAVYSFFSRMVFRLFLGHPVWHLMKKQVTKPTIMEPPLKTRKSLHDMLGSVFLVASSGSSGSAASLKSDKSSSESVKKA